MHFHIISLFPGAFDSYLGESILKRAIFDKKIKVSFYNPRDYADNEYKRIDQKPYGGGPGMVIQALPVIKAISKAVSSIEKLESRKSKGTSSKIHGSRYKILFFNPDGKQFDTHYAKDSAKKYDHIILVCGRYEGIDARIKKAFKMEDVSVGPFVLTGGELPAMIVIDSVSRQVEGVLGNFDSREEERVSSPDVYTRPEVFVYKNKKLRVPKVLLSGNHAEIDAWRESRKRV
ncbi:MAG TPA: tRNA (guanosine(37)-N1)-methyltransferase TrmD [Candidatus Paceibacterota bacterium]|jgi:tRNA (guanine37-N1)-methyltransferase|nr:tRNA (guanosine(37)-N1)-methyltransferase TrmD [Candidatus Paceibacterota bacterium]